MLLALAILAMATPAIPVVLAMLVTSLLQGVLAMQVFKDRYLPEKDD